MQNIRLDAGAAALLARLHGAGYAAYAVGGCVRDSLLGRTPQDWDLCTSARPEQVLALFGEGQCIPTGLQHGTVTIKYGGQLYETTKLIDWVFESFSIQAALDTDQALAEIPVKYSSDTDTLQLYPADSMMTLLPSTGDGSVTQKYFHLPDYATAPIQQGDVVGTVELKLAGETIGVVNLIAGQDVHQNALLFTVSKVQAFFHSLYLKVVIVLSLLTLAVYGLWVFINLWNGRRPNRKIHRR